MEYKVVCPRPGYQRDNESRTDDSRAFPLYLTASLYVKVSYLITRCSEKGAALCSGPGPATHYLAVFGQIISLLGLLIYFSIKKKK